MSSPSQRLAACSLAILIALYVVGAVSIPPGSLRHEVQTLPLWFPIVLGFQKRDITKWMAVPLLIFWLAIMMFIWLFLLGWARFVTGHFFPTEIAMTLVIGAACVTALIASLRWKTSTRPHVALGVTLLFALLQLLAFRISLIPYIGRR
ncbi:MAG TPA: hypothetical protein VGX46_02045 [Vicinamibacterales bacterium]|jgi:hypothetical protein|nr:hypothetical protein [Vicinamibacterales bacterium]